MRLIELTKNYAVRIIVCCNQELLNEQYGLDDVDDIADDFFYGISDVIMDNFNELPDYDYQFKNWHGGKYSNHFCLVCIEYFCRQLDASIINDIQNDGTLDDFIETDVIYDEWDWIDKDEVPIVITKGIESIISDAIGKAEKNVQETIKHIM